MKLYNSNKDKIEDIKVIITNEGTFYSDRILEEELNSLGFYKVEYNSTGNRRYYTSEAMLGLVGNKFVVGYTITDKPLDQVKKSMLKDLKDTFNKETERPRVLTSMGYEVDGSRNDLENFEIGKKFGFPIIVDADDVSHDATDVDYDNVISAIQIKGIELFQRYRDKKDEIKAFTTVDECVLYEATPYEYTITEEDLVDDIDGTLVVGDVVTRYTNNVTQW